MATNLILLIREEEQSICRAAFSHARHNHRVTGDALAEQYVDSFGPAALRWVYSQIAAKKSSLLETTTIVVIGSRIDTPSIRVPLLNICVPSEVSLYNTQSVMQPVVAPSNAPGFNFGVVALALLPPAGCNVVGDFHPCLQDPRPNVTPYPQKTYLPINNFCLNSSAVSVFTPPVPVPGRFYYQSSSVSWERIGLSTVSIWSDDRDMQWYGDHVTVMDNDDYDLAVEGNNLIITSPALAGTSPAIAIKGRAKFYPAYGTLTINNLNVIVPDNKATYPFPTLLQYEFLKNNRALMELGVYLYYLTPDDTRWQAQMPEFLNQLQLLFAMEPSNLLTKIYTASSSLSK